MTRSRLDGGYGDGHRVLGPSLAKNATAEINRVGLESERLTPTSGKHLN